MKKLLLALLLMGSFVKQTAMAGGSHHKVFSNKMTFPFGQGGNRLMGVPKNTIYITIDDGPIRGVTDEVLEILSEFGIKATFFVVGNVAKRSPHLLERMYREGHLVGNHSYGHETDFPTTEFFWNSLLGTHNTIAPYVSSNNLFLFRAPGGIWNDWRTTRANDHKTLSRYVGPIFWNVGGGSDHRNDDADWKCWTKGVSPEACANGYMQGIYRQYKNSRATILLMHDLNIKSAKMLRIILRKLQRDDIDWKFELIDQIPAVQDFDR